MFPHCFPRIRRALRARAVRMAAALGVWLWCAGLPPAHADEVTVRICFDYACAHEAQARFDDAALTRVVHLMAGARDAAHERTRLADAVAWLYVEAGRQTPVWRDRGGNRNDNTDLPGAMDCLDHAANTTAFLHLLGVRGLLRFHYVAAPVQRVRWYGAEHWSARVVETASSEEYAVDTWYFDPGIPAAVMPLQAWRDGEVPVAGAPLANDLQLREAATWWGKQ